MLRVDTGIDRGHEEEATGGGTSKRQQGQKKPRKNKEQEPTQKLTEGTQNSDQAG